MARVRLSPHLDTPGGEPRRPGLIRFARLRVVFPSRFIRSVPLLVKQIVIPPRRPIESASREEGLGEKLEAGSSGLSPKLECTDRNLIVSDC